MTEDDAKKAKYILRDLEAAWSLDSKIHRLYKQAKEDDEARSELANIALELAKKWEDSLSKELREL